MTPTFLRPREVEGLLENLRDQRVRPVEVVIVDGAPALERATADVVQNVGRVMPFECRYIRHAGGTAVQRNAGIDIATGDALAFIDDDIRLEPDFFARIDAVLAADVDRRVGGVVGYRTNQHFTLESAARWRWYRRLGLLSTLQPGRYDFLCGYPINADMQPPFAGVREVDFMTTSCAVWRRQVFDSGMRFDPFFTDYGVLEDAHFALRAGRRWTLLQCGDARCVHLRSALGRADPRCIGRKAVENYYYVFRQIVQPLSWRHKVRFWRFQLFELLRIGSSAVFRRRLSDLAELQGRLEGMLTVARGRLAGG